MVVEGLFDSCVCKFLRTNLAPFLPHPELPPTDKNKYNSPKYRLVVRTTKTDIIAQIVYAKINGDVTMAAAYSHELPNFGIKVGLTNYAAAYATGLLLARRVLTKLGLADAYEGNDEVNGELYMVEENESGPRPFFAILDVGLKRTTTGNRMFGVLKGAADGGIEIPHSERRFPGFDEDENTYAPEVHRDRIFGQHVASYMKELAEEDKDAYEQRFKRYIAAGVSADDLEGMYQAAHAAIREDPVVDKKVSNKPPKDQRHKYRRPAKRHISQRRDRAQMKIDSLAAKIAALQEQD